MRSVSRFSGDAGLRLDRLAMGQAYPQGAGGGGRPDGRAMNYWCIAKKGVSFWTQTSTHPGWERANAVPVPERPLRQAVRSS
jgi:hypothetical protein